MTITVGGCAGLAILARSGSGTSGMRSAEEQREQPASHPQDWTRPRPRVHANISLPGVHLRNAQPAVWMSTLVFLGVSAFYYGCCKIYHGRWQSIPLRQL